MESKNLEGKKLPSVVFKTRAKKEKGDFDWKDVSSDEIFRGKKVVVFCLPGAFTPTCSSTHLPGYEANYAKLKNLGIDEIYCLSVNDAFVMNAWAKDQKLANVKLLPDGSGDFTSALGMLVKKDNLGFGGRSWRYSFYAEDGIIKKAFVEPGFSDNCPTDPFEISDALTMVEYLKNK